MAFFTKNVQNLFLTVYSKLPSISWTNFFVKKAMVYDKDGNQVAFIRRKFWSVHDRYFVQSSLGNLEITGNILGFDYHIILDGKEIGHVTRKISLRDSFVLSLEDGYDLSFFVAFVIAIDNITDQRSAEASSSY